MLPDDNDRYRDYSSFEVMLPSELNYYDESFSVYPSGYYSVNLNLDGTNIASGFEVGYFEAYDLTKDEFHEIEVSSVDLECYAGIALVYGAP
jgi:hypothetical protein